MSEAIENTKEVQPENVSEPAEGRKNMGIGAKVYGLVAICLGVAALIGGTSFWQFSQIGIEIEAIAERDVPVTNALSQITVHQLEQEISMERAFRYGELLKTDSRAAELFGKSKKKFEAYNTKINKELKDAEALIAKARDTAHTAKEKALFQAALDTTVEIDKAHHNYFEQTEAIFSLIQAGNLKKAHVEEDKIETLVTNLNHKIEGLLKKFSDLTAQAAYTAEAHEKTALLMIIVISIIGIVLGAIMSFLIVRNSVNRPLRTILDKVELLATGQYDIEIKVLTNNEIGRIFAAVQKLRDGLLKALELEKEQVALEKKTVEAEQKRVLSEQEATEKEEQRREQAAKDAEERSQRMEEIISGFDSNVKIALETVSSAATEMHASAQAMTNTADQTSQRTSTVAAASEEASGNIQTVASAAEELSASVGEISRQVKESSSIAEKAVQEASETNEKVQGLADAAQKIGEVVNLINDIASQTNLLALNATIEAARAGDAGKGFAVVASEVKSLATQTGKATEEIGGQIHEIQEATGEAVQAIGGISDIISQISEISGAISAAVEEQGAASREIASNVAQAATGTQEVSGNIVEVNQAATETGANAAQVLSAADELARQGDALKGQVDQFLLDIRAA